MQPARPVASGQQSSRPPRPATPAELHANQQRSGQRPPARAPRPATRSSSARLAKRYDPATYQPQPVNVALQRVREIIEVLAVVSLSVAVALLMKAFVVQAFFIPSGSMEDTLVTDDRIVVNKLAHRLGDVERGDILVFRSPPAEQEANPEIEHLIKRVVALPGDLIFSQDGVLYVNGQPAREPYVKPGAVTEDVEEQVVEQGEYWMMGDNREDSQDSRFFGSIPEDLIVGQAFVRVWPLNSLSSL